MSAAEIIRWLQTHAADTTVYIGEGGLTLETAEGSYLEVGGEPEPETGNG